jgi:superfamily I DNA and/or RNA helicase
VTDVRNIADPQQLPPTVISTKAESLGYNQSLFVRMVQGHPEAMHLLRYAQIISVLRACSQPD